MDTDTAVEVDTPVQEPTDDIVDPVESPDSPHPPPKLVHPLSSVQERKLLDYLEEKFLDVTRNFKKRSDPSSTLTTLPLYLEATHHMLSLILQIPPVDPSTSLRTSLFLRLTGEVLQSIPGYTPSTDVLTLLLAWLRDLDHGWLVVLRQEAWDADTSSAVPARLPQGARAAPASQTDRTRLRSVLLAGADAIEEWLERLDAHGEGFELVLERVGLEQEFNDLFAGTLAEMGSLGGTMSDPAGMQGTC